MKNLLSNHSDLISPIQRIKKDRNIIENKSMPISLNKQIPNLSSLDAKRKKISALEISNDVILEHKDEN